MDMDMDMDMNMDLDMAMDVVTLQLSATERYHHRQEWVVRLRM
jgi:hypothetical protein